MDEDHTQFGFIEVTMALEFEAVIIFIPRFKTTKNVGHDDDDTDNSLVVVCHNLFFTRTFITSVNKKVFSTKTSVSRHEDDQTKLNLNNYNQI